jgi:hypothetical protein
MSSRPTATTASLVATDLDALIVAIGEQAERWRDPAFPDRADAVDRTLALDNTFGEEAIAFAVNQQVGLAMPGALRAWVRGRRAVCPLDVAVLNPGNVPFVEFQDFLAVVLTGHRYLGALSSRSPYLLPAFVAGVAARVEALPVAFVPFESALTTAKTVIASGDDATLARIAALCDTSGIGPAHRLLRGHRFGVAILDGRETEDELEAIAEDALLHEGRGCRNVAVIWAPAGYPPDALLEAFAAFRGVFPAHAKTPTSLKMRQAMLHALGIPHAYGDDLSFLLSKGEPEAQEPGHIRWTEYEALEEVDRWLEERKKELQIVSVSERLGQRLRSDVVRCLPGDTQRPAVDWRPDSIDTIDFLVRCGDTAASPG